MPTLPNFLEIALLVGLNSLSIFLIVIVLANAKNRSGDKWFVAMAVFLIGWINCSYLGFSLESLSQAAFFYHLNDVFVAAFLIAAYHYYIEDFLGLKNKIAKLLHYAINGTFILAALFTNLSTKSVEPRSWGNEPISGIAFELFSVYALAFTSLLLGLFWLKYRSYSQAEKRKVFYFLLGTASMIALNIAFNVIAPVVFKTLKYQHFGDYSAIFFLALTAYAIVGRKFMDIRVVLTASLIGIIGMLLIVDIFALSHTNLERGIKSLILTLFIGISILLVRSVLNEVKQREQLAKTNADLEKSRQRLADLANEQRDIIDIMGHEIRTPLTAIVQETKLHKKYTLPLEKTLLKEAAEHENLKKILPYLLDTVKTTDRATAQAVALVTDMLETARLDKKRFELNYESFDLIPVITSSLELMEKTLPEQEANKYNLYFEKPAVAELAVEADKTRVGQAVYALLSNAIKYHDPLKEQVNISVSLRKKGDFAAICIADNGIGIAAEDIAKLGKKFTRLNTKSASNLPRPGGTGLGLFVVKGIADHHNGSLRIASTGLGEGAQFTLEIPLKKS